MPKKTTLLTSFCRSQKQICHLSRPERYRELKTLEKPILARGKGSSYGDAPLNENGNVILTERLNRILDFDSDTGFITIEAGATLTEILGFITKQGWFLPVTPGTQNVSIGGCIATDVHGKNHSSAGSIANYVRWLELILANGTTIRCSKNESPEIFWATVGGMGLTGIIGTVSLSLKPIHSTSITVKQQSFTTWDELFELFHSSELQDEYSIAWLDALNQKEEHECRGIFSRGHHATVEELTHNFSATSSRQSHAIPLPVPFRLLNRLNVSLFNKLYFNKQNKKTSPFCMHYQSYFYPLDTISNWNTLYGKKGFLQYQCVLPNNAAKEGIKKILAALKEAHYSIFLASIKKMGPNNKGYLSFATEGFTLAIDLPITNISIFGLLNEIDATVSDYHGKVYLAKDFRLSTAMFRKMYPQYQQWLKIKNEIDPDHVFSSSLSRRLELC